jgi:hypothetical protein
MKEFRFWGNEIVRLKKDRPDAGLKAGDCGVVWGVYDMKPPLFEASFFDENGENTDMMFEEQDVEEVLDIKEATFSEKLEETRRLFNEFEAKLRQEKENK